VGGACGTHGRGVEIRKDLGGKPEGKRPLERPRRRWEEWIRMYHREIDWGLWSGFTWLRIAIVGWLL
jgi:hypothetical protein